MSETFNAQLRIPAEKRFLPLVQNHVRALAGAGGFSHKDALSLELAAEEAFQNICLHAYPGGERGDVMLDTQMLQGEIRLSFQDEGLPFDLSLLKRGAPSAPETASLGLTLIHNAVDEAHWINKGRQGKALLLVKRLPEHDENAPGEQPQPTKRAKRPRAPEQPYDIRPLQPDEALQVTRLFWLAYGYSYKNESFYRPEGLLDLVNQGKLLSYVAVTREGDVVGHAGLLRPGPEPMAEMGLLIVSPEHRGRGLMEGFGRALDEKAQALELFGVSFNPVTSHSVSQRQSIAMGGVPCGLELGACPPRIFKGMKKTDRALQRESYLHCFRYLAPPPPALAHVPQRHRPMIERIYEKLGRTLLPSSPQPDAESENEPGEYTVSFDRGLLKGRISVARGDTTLWPELRRAASDLVHIAGAEVVHLDLPLAHPATAPLCEIAEESGFVFTGVRPHAAKDSDLLRLTRLACPFSLKHLRLYTRFVKDLGAYIEEELMRVGGCE